MKRLPLFVVLLVLAVVPGFASTHGHSASSDHQFHFPANSRLSKAFKQKAAQHAQNSSKSSAFPHFPVKNQSQSKRGYRRATASNPPTGKPAFVSSSQISVGGFLGYNDGEPTLSGDFNGDGKLDAVTMVETDTGYAFSVVLGNGDGTFQAPALQTIIDSCAILAAGDVNGDGKEDIVVVHSATQCSNVTSSFDVYLGNGDGTFTQKNNYALTSNQLSGGTLQDVNGDGFLDVVVVDQANPGNVWTVLGNGDGTFSASPTSVAISGQVRQAVLADLNGDGVLDVAGLDANSNQVTTYLAANPPMSYASGAAITDAAYNAESLSVGDLNGDGFPDIITANGDDSTITVYVNNQSGGFAAGTDYNTAVGGSPSGSAGLNAVAVAVADVNGDGKADIVASDGGANQITVLLGNGDGTVNVPMGGYAVGGNAAQLTSALVADFNGDGFADILVPDDAFSLEFAKGYGDGTFRAATSYYTAAGAASEPETYGTVSADFNGDGIPDLAIGTFNDAGAGSMTVFLSNPDGSMQAGVSYGAGIDLPFLVVGDFNKDGKLDIAASDYYDGMVQIFTGNGDGTFTPGATFVTDSDPEGASDLVAVDFNGDGYLDLAVLNWWDGTVGVLLNDQTGNFPTLVNYQLTGSSYSGITAADVTGDGKIDLVIPLIGGSSVAILVGNGDGTFQQESPTTDVSLSTYTGVDSLVVADLNGDGIPDMAVTLGNGGGSDIAILLGAGNGVFNLSTVVASSLQDFTLTNSPEPWAIKAVDLDGDGNLDLVYSNTHYGTIGILYGQGAGAFYDPVEYPADGGSFGVTIADVNNDGAPDIVTASYDDLSGVSVLLNASGAGTMGNYTVAATQNTATVSAGATATFDLTVTPSNHYNGTVTFSCGTSLPSKATCTFNPTSAVLDGNTPVSVQLSISTTATTTAQLMPHRGSPVFLASFGGMGLFGMVLAGSLKKRSRWTGLLLGMLIVTMMFSLVACGGSSSSGNNGGGGNTTNPGTPAGSYTVIVTATGTAGTNNGNTSAHPFNLTLTVQ